MMFIGTAAVGAKLPYATDLSFASATAGLVTSQTFSGQSLGSAHATRVIACRAMIHNTVPSTRTIGSLTLDGNAMTLVAQTNNTGGAARVVSGIYYLAYPSGTTGTFVLTVAGVQLNAGWGIKPVAMYYLKQQAPRTSGTDNTGGGTATSLSMTLNRLSGSIQVFTRSGSGVGGSGYSSTNFTSTADSISATQGMQNGFDQAQAAGTGITFTSSTSVATYGAFVGAIWR